MKETDMNSITKQAENFKPRISVAPMMDWTDRHCRYFHRLICPQIFLYTEMVSTGAILHGDKNRHLMFSAIEKPLALQLGGSDAPMLEQCAKIGADYGYDEINLNCGCPSDRVQEYEFGACMMKRPDHVGKCFEAMQKGAGLVPVSIKCRIAVDDEAEFPFLDRFIKATSNAGCKKFTIHARKAWLNGLSPKENREIPPLRYDIAADIKQAYPGVSFELNGGIKTISDIKNALQSFDRAMIGREAYQNPWFLNDIAIEFFGGSGRSRLDIARAMIPYMESQKADNGTPYKAVTRHMLGLFNGIRGGRHWRQTLSEEAKDAQNASDLIEKALKKIEVPT